MCSQVGIVVARAVPARHANLRPLFDFLDTDHSGSLSLQELRAGLKDDTLQVCCPLLHAALLC